MYESFYELSPTPFRLTPDPQFFFETTSHKRGLAFLRYAFLQQEGIVVITGAPGTGKTELMLNLIDELPQEKVTLAKLVSSNLGADDLLDIIAASFPSIQKSSSKGVTLTKLEEYFRYQARLGKRVLILIDEAHNLPVKSLIELSMLTNFQIDGTPVLQCFLIGQESLEKTFALPDLAHLKQRVVASTRLKPLSQLDTRAYIEHRLTKAGWKRDPEFSKTAHALIYQYSEGIPRKINTICNRVLLEAYLNGKHIIDHKLAFRIINEIQEELGESPMIIDPKIISLPTIDDPVTNSKEIHQINKALSRVSSTSANSTNAIDRMPTNPNRSIRLTTPSNSLSTPQSYSNDHNGLIVAEKPQSSNKKHAFATSPAPATPNNVHQLNARKNIQQNPGNSEIKKTALPNNAIKTVKTAQSLAHTKQPVKRTNENHQHTTFAEENKRKTGLIKKEQRKALPVDRDMSKNEAIIHKPEIDPLEAHFKEIILEELIHDQTFQSSNTIARKKEYERLSTIDTTNNWSPISVLGVAISVIGLLFFWWFIYGPGLDTTLEAIDILASTIHNKLNDFNI
jgi:general secretion pathway protein A